MLAAVSVFSILSSGIERTERLPPAVSMSSFVRCLIFVVKMLFHVSYGIQMHVI